MVALLLESKRKNSTPKLKQPNFVLGNRGEVKAAQFLQAKGYQLLARNYRSGQDEIDLICFDPHYQELVFVEVKTRSTDDYGDPSLAFDLRKLRAQVRAARHYLTKHPSSFDYRFDLVTILPATISHFENLTWLAS